MKLAQSCWCIVPAAGVGRRIGAAVPKQYLSLGDRAIIEHTIMALLDCGCFEKIIVVLSPDDTLWTSLDIASHPMIETTEGGETRADSVLCGLTFLERHVQQNDWVCVHDAARPCVTSDMVKPLMAAVEGHSVGGVLGIPVVDTVKYVSFKGEVEKTLPRENIWLAQTPQVFRYAMLRKALQHAMDEGYIITDESSAIELLGEVPKMVLGDPANLKVTSWADFYRVKAIIEGAACE